MGFGLPKSWVDCLDKSDVMPKKDWDIVRVDPDIEIPVGSPDFLNPQSSELNDPQDCSFKLVVAASASQLQTTFLHA